MFVQGCTPPLEICSIYNRKNLNPSPWHIAQLIFSTAVFVSHAFYQIHSFETTTAFFLFFFFRQRAVLEHINTECLFNTHYYGNCFTIHRFKIREIGAMQMCSLSLKSQWRQQSKIRINLKNWQFKAWNISTNYMPLVARYILCYASQTFHFLLRTNSICPRLKSHFTLYTINCY